MSQFNYFFRSHPTTLAELKRLKIKLVDVDTGEGYNWPGLELPNGDLLVISADDEGNGPGAIHVYPKDQIKTAP